MYEERLKKKRKMVISTVLGREVGIFFYSAEAFYDAILLL